MFCQKKNEVDQHGTMSRLFSTCVRIINAQTISNVLKQTQTCCSKEFVTKRTFKALTGILHHGEYEWKDAETEEEIVNVHITDRNGKRTALKGKVGDNLLFLARRFEIEMEGACEASLACTTCHVYVSDKDFDKLPEATEEEEDLLDTAPLLEPSSRLGCQIILSKDLEGLEVELPKMTRNFYVDGHVPKPH